MSKVSVSRVAGPPHVGTAGLVELRHFLDGRAHALEGDFRGQHHRQVCRGYRHGTAAVAVDDGDGRAPVALARYAPVAQAVVGGALALALLGQAVGDGVEGGREIQAVELTGIDGDDALLVCVPVLPGRHVVAVLRSGLGDHLHDRQRILAGELVVALVVAGYRHDRAGAVGGQHEVGHPDRQLLAGQRVNGTGAGGHAQFFHGRQLGLGHLAAADLLDKLRQRRVGLGGLPGDRVLRGDRHVGGAHQGIGAGGVHLQGVLAAGQGSGQAKAHGHALGAAYPVALHGAHLLGPVLQLVYVGQQFLGVGGDAEEPLVYLAPLHRVVAAPAAAVHHLLVGQHRLVGFAPVDLGLFLVGQALLEQAGEEPLLPAVVAGIAGGDFPVPVVGEAQLAQLFAHVVDILRGPLGGRHIVLDGGVLRRQAKGIPAHGLQHVPALHALVAGDDVGDGVVAHMPHVQFAAGIGKHGQAVEFLPAVVPVYGEAVVFQPVSLGGLLEFLWVVVLVHDGCLVASLQ